MLKSIIDDYLTKSKQQEIFDAFDGRNYNVWPTEASIQKNGELPHGACLRKVWYRLHGFNQIPLDASIIRKFTLGHLMEDQEIEWAREAGILDSNGVKIQMPNPLAKNQIISGKYDFVVNINGKKVIIEYKTSSGWYFNSKVMKEGHVKIEHLLQIGLYLYFMGSYLSYGYLSYANRSGWERRDFRIDLINNVLLVDGISTNININMIFERWKRLDDYIKNKEFPPRDFIPIFTEKDEEEAEKMVENGIISKKIFQNWLMGEAILSDFHCTWCPYKHHCLLDNYKKRNLKNSADVVWKIVNFLTEKNNLGV